MPAYRRGKYKKRTRKSTKRSKKQGYNYKVRRPLALKQHEFVERTFDTELKIGTEAGTYAATGLFKAFMANDIPQWDSYSKLFEQYKLNKVVVDFRYKCNSVPALLSGGSATINEVNPMLYFKIDHNDVNADTLQLMKKSTRTKIHQFTNDKPHFSISLKPASQKFLLRTINSGGIPIGTNSPAWGQWLDADGPTGDGSQALHFGLKAYAIGYVDQYIHPGSILVSYKYYFSAKCNE